MLSSIFGILWPRLHECFLWVAFLWHSPSAGRGIYCCLLQLLAEIVVLASQHCPTYKLAMCSDHPQRLAGPCFSQNGTSADRRPLATHSFWTYKCCLLVSPLSPWVCRTWLCWWSFIMSWSASRCFMVWQQCLVLPVVSSSLWRLDLTHQGSSVHRFWEQSIFPGRSPCLLQEIFPTETSTITSTFAGAVNTSEPSEALIIRYFQ